MAVPEIATASQLNAWRDRLATHPTDYFGEIGPGISKTMATPGIIDGSGAPKETWLQSMKIKNESQKTINICMPLNDQCTFFHTLSQ